MDSRTEQAIRDMRHDLMVLEVQLANTKQGDYYRPKNGQKFSTRDVLEDQILELRMRLKEMVEWEKEDEMQNSQSKANQKSV